jgi:hypothetical protein
LLDGIDRWRKAQAEKRTTGRWTASLPRFHPGGEIAKSHSGTNMPSKIRIDGFHQSVFLFRVCFSFLFLWACSALAQNLPAHIEIVTVEGEGATSKARQRVSREPAVRVEDDDHRPIPGAAVVFALPVSGSSGEFLNGSKTLTTVTDKDGVATASGLRTNQVPGRMQIYVTGSYRGLRAKTLITQFIEAEPGANGKAPEIRASKSKWKWVVLGAVAAGGAGAGAYFAQQRSASSSPMSITTGSVVFGNPR